MWRTRNDAEGGSLSTAAAARDGRVRRAYRELFLQLLIIVATLAAIEVFLRVLDLRELRDGYGSGHSLVYRYDPELGWFPIPNTVATFTGARQITIRNNSLGLRDIERDSTAR